MFLGLNWIVGRHQRNPSKLAPYESGVPLLDENRKRVNVRFYQIAMLFILFDIEAAFLYPWAVIYRDATRAPARWHGSSSARCSSSSLCSASATSTSGRRKPSTGSNQWLISIPTILTLPTASPIRRRRSSFRPRRKKKFDYILTRYPNKEAALLPTLHLVAGDVGLDLARGRALRRRAARPLAGDRLRRRLVLQHVQPEAGREVPPAGLHEPVLHGRPRVRHLRAPLREAERQPGQTTKDGRYTVVEVECLGSCGTAPVVQVNNDYHENMNVDEDGRCSS